MVGIIIKVKQPMRGSAGILTKSSTLYTTLIQFAKKVVIFAGLGDGFQPYPLLFRNCVRAEKNSGLFKPMDAKIWGTLSQLFS